MSDERGLYKRGEIWWIAYGHNGQTYRESSGSEKVTVARALRKQRLAECGRLGRPLVDEEKLTLGDLRDGIVTDYEVNGRRSTARMKLSFSHLVDYFGKDRPALSISPARVREYQKARQEEGASNGSINRELAALKRAFNLKRKDGALSRVPHIPMLAEHNVRQGFLTRGDVDAICKEISDDLAPVVRFAFLTGWRKREVLGLRWSAVDFAAGQIRLEGDRSKNKEPRTFPFGALPELAALLREQRERTRAVERQTGQVVPWVFHRAGQRVRSMNGAWKGACKRAGLTGSLFHDLRRSAVRNMERAGVSRSVAMSFSGHKTESVYRRYAIVDAAAQAEAAAKLAALQERDTEDRSALPLRRQA